MEREMVSDVAQIYDVWKAYGSAVYEGDLNRWLALWIDDSKRLAPNAPASVGLEQIRIAVEPLFELFDFEAFGVNPDEVQIFGDQAYSHGTYGFSMMPKAGGDVIEDRGKFLTILEKQVDGSCKIAVDCFNSDLPKP
jgi:ketosteroid isomerase-like protein